MKGETDVTREAMPADGRAIAGAPGGTATLVKRARATERSLEGEATEHFTDRAQGARSRPSEPMSP